MSYFDDFPQMYYTLEDPSSQKFKTVVNIFARALILLGISNNINAFYNYYVKDGDTPEDIAYKFYNDPTLHWVVLFANLILDPYYQWPLTQNNLETQMITNYGSVANALTTLDHIEKHTNVIVTENYAQTINTYVSIIGNTVIAIDGSSVFPTLNNPVLQVGTNNVVEINGAVIDTSVQLYWISAYQQLTANNEANRNIQLIQPSYVPGIVQQFNNLMSP